MIPLPPRRALIKLGYACNNRCAFCHATDNQPLPPMDAAGVRRKIRAARAMGAEQVLFSGGEPTLFRELLLHLRAAQAEGLGSGVVTNGRRLAYAPLVERLVQAGLAYAYVSLHGADPVAHDRLVGVPGAHSQAVQGIRNLLDHPQVEVTVNVVVVKGSLPYLTGVPALLGAPRPYRLKFSWVEPKGRAQADFDDVVPTLTEAAPLALAAMAEAATQLPPGSPPPGYDGFPPCVMGGRLDGMDDLLTHGILHMSEAFEPGFYPCDHGQRAFAPACIHCALKRDCPGVYEGYLARAGTDELRPVASRS